MELFRHLHLEGEVVAATSDGEAAYLVVRVAGLGEAVIVPTARAAEFAEDEEAALTAAGA
jgi:hypothetical protein